jgi:ABC-type enterochelin transport system substrate-binding protein
MGGDVLSSTEVVIKNCYVGGTLTKDEILDEVNPEWLFAIHQIVGQIIGSATAKIKN